jgi:hypothetical protein
VDVSGQGLLVEVSSNHVFLTLLQVLLVGSGRQVFLVDGDGQGFMVDSGRWDAGVVVAWCVQESLVDEAIGTGFWWTLVVLLGLVDFFPWTVVGEQGSKISSPLRVVDMMSR